MTTETLRPYVDSPKVKSAPRPAFHESIPSQDHVNEHTDLEESGQKTEFQQVIFFLTFTLKESIQQTLYTFLQDFKCTYLLLSELHKPYVDTIRVLVPLWLTVLHAICLVVLVLVHKITIKTTARIQEVLAGPLDQFTRWTECHVPRVFQPLASPAETKHATSVARPSTPAVQAFQDPKPQPQGQLSKSRTLGVFTGISASFPRTSLIPSRRTNNSSAASSVSATQLATTETPRSKTSSATRLPFSRSGRLSLGSRKSDSHLSENPFLIYTEQPPSYWTGRFVSLHDKLQSECLTDQNLRTLLNAQTERAVARNQQRQPQLLSNTRYSRYNTRLPPSATSAAVLQQTGRGSMSTRDLTAQAVDAAMLLDDDERCRRVFNNLEIFCATDEARKSLLAWQQEFARKTGRKNLLPKGGTMEDRVWVSYFSRVGVKKMGKRASIM
ncbi:hypothetical protein VP1G_01008 [Cytospora mali]|uniref:Uncharacterized protein n=1 Tax=Cytospora mali TaxID=578113 RepID=A0A194UPJ3_CYTMA|nr:hypothetical protein VP1G_01008 [Valsa mali var. pyri (nom. inval.)]